MYLFQPSYSKNKSDAYLKNVKTYITGLSQAGGRGGGTVFGRLVNYLNQGGGTHYAHQVTTFPPGFSDLATALHKYLFCRVFFFAFDFAVNVEVLL